MGKAERIAFLEEEIQSLRHYIEQRGGYTSLYAVESEFAAEVSAICYANEELEKLKNELD